MSKREIKPEWIAKRIPAGKVKIGDVIILKGRPCRIIKISRSKTGKHGHAKMIIDGTAIDNEDELADVFPMTGDVHGLQHIRD